jgi:hypothetical protein
MESMKQAKSTQSQGAYELMKRTLSVSKEATDDDEDENSLFVPQYERSSKTSLKELMAVEQKRDEEIDQLQLDIKELEAQLARVLVFRERAYNRLGPDDWSGSFMKMKKLMKREINKLQDFSKNSPVIIEDKIHDSIEG